MSTTAEKLAYLMGTKTGIRDKIISKGVDVPDTTVFREYIDKIGLIKDGDIIVSGLVYVPGNEMKFTLTDWDADLQGTTYELVCTGYKIGDSGLQLGLPSDSSTVNTQAVVAAALTIVDTDVTEPDQKDKRPGKTTVTISAVNAPEQELVIALFGLEACEPVTVSDAAVVGVTPPAAGAAPVTEIDNEQYSGAVTWAPEISGGVFAENTVYTATITLTAKPGYTFQGSPADFFTVAGASSATNIVNTGVVTAVFPATGEVTP